MWFCQQMHQNLCQLLQKQNIPNDNMASESVYKDMPVMFLGDLVKETGITFTSSLPPFLSSLPLWPKMLLFRIKMLEKAKQKKRLIDKSLSITYNWRSDHTTWALSIIHPYKDHVYNK